jgi:hypothetical protein
VVLGSLALPSSGGLPLISEIDNRDDLIVGKDDAELSVRAIDGFLALAPASCIFPGDHGRYGFAFPPPALSSCSRFRFFLSFLRGRAGPAVVTSLIEAALPHHDRYFDIPLLRPIWLSIRLAQ